jgi:hypothetical protein
MRNKISWKVQLEQFLYQLFCSLRHFWQKNEREEDGKKLGKEIFIDLRIKTITYTLSELFGWYANGAIFVCWQSWDIILLGWPFLRFA